MDEKRKVVILAIFIAMIITLGIVGFYYWYNSTYYVTTEDARVAADFTSIIPQISGKLLDFNVQEGDRVTQDQIIGRLEADSGDDSRIEPSLLRAPISGLIVKKQAAIGEFCAAGSVLAVMIDPKQEYISANIEETKLEKIRPGQRVEIRIDQYHGKIFKGKLESIGQAANSAFSMLPSSTGDTFTKVVQKVPIKIELELTNVNLLPGTNAVIKIHVK
jgi:Multidrug resistance efflux pump